MCPLIGEMSTDAPTPDAAAAAAAATTDGAPEEPRGASPRPSGAPDDGKPARVSSHDKLDSMNKLTVCETTGAIEMAYSTAGLATSTLAHNTGGGGGGGDEGAEPEGAPAAAAAPVPPPLVPCADGFARPASFCELVHLAAKAGIAFDPAAELSWPLPILLPRVMLSGQPKGSYTLLNKMYGQNVIVRRPGQPVVAHRIVLSFFLSLPCVVAPDLWLVFKDMPMTDGERIVHHDVLVDQITHLYLQYHTVCGVSLAVEGEGDGTGEFSGFPLVGVSLRPLNVLPEDVCDSDKETDERMRRYFVHTAIDTWINGLLHTYNTDVGPSGRTMLSDVQVVLAVIRAGAKRPSAGGDKADAAAGGADKGKGKGKGKEPATAAAHIPRTPMPEPGMYGWKEGGPRDGEQLNSSELALTALCVTQFIDPHGMAATAAALASKHKKESAAE